MKKYCKECFTEITSTTDTSDLCYSCKTKPAIDYKFDKDKVHMELLPFECLTEIAKVLTYGAKKYKINSWQTVENARERYRGALLRHMAAMQAGEKIDLDSGLLHSAHLACNAIFLLWFTLHEENDDKLYKKE